MATLGSRLCRLECHLQTADPAYQAAHDKLNAEIEATAAKVAQRLGTTPEAVIADAMARVEAEYAARTTEGTQS